jgi:hypothetical protein
MIASSIHASSQMRLSDSGRSVGVGEGFGEPGEEQVEASVEFGGAVVGGEDRCQGAEVGEVGDRQSVQTEPQNVVCFFGSFDDFLQFIDDVAVQVGE